MKNITIIIFCGSFASPQELQLHYDCRYSVDPVLNEANVPWINFKYFKIINTPGKGDFLSEVQTYLNGKKQYWASIYTNGSKH